ncbi:MAG TPA: DUF5947 family protein [Planctomycetaceae bacterium]|jgi:hypothetical protein|nr:DUF5947 family protein [Planctomycetaceae bacterium]
MSAGFSSLKQTLGRVREAATKREPRERCELCGLALAPEHRHLVEIATQRLICSCEACGLLFSGQATKYRRVPQRFLLLDDFQLTDAQWDSLLIPINMAFFFQSTSRGRPVAIYPSPAGPMESLLDLSSWSELVEANPVLQTMEPDVEALLVNRISSNSAPGGQHDAVDGQSGPHYFLVPIDACYKLVGLIRANWRGLSGGQDVWKEIERFFTEMRATATVACRQ